METNPPETPAPDPFDLLFVGTHGHVVAVHKFTGKDVWRKSLPGTGWSVVALLIEDGVLYAASQGHVFALDPLTGEIFWENSMPGLGNGHACLATFRHRTDEHENPIPQAAASQAAKHHHGTVVP